MATFPITSPVPDLPFEMKQTFAGESVFVKNAYTAGILTTASFTPITDIDYPSFHSYAVTSITRSGSVATVTTTATNSLEVGNTIIVAGANQAEYNGTFTVASIVTPGSVFTYAVSGAPATPATGTITVNGGWTTVPGIVYIDDYIVVGRVDGEIQNCDRSTYTDWDPLSFITPEKESSQLVRIAKSINYGVALKEWDTEFFYNAEIDPPGSPFLFQDSAYLKLGCASASTVVEFDGGIAFVSKRDQLQRSREVHVLNGLTPKKISTPEVERLLNASDLETNYSLYLSTAGHQLYVLTLTDLEITIVYDFGNGFWGQWTLLTAQSPKTVTGLSSSGKTAVAILPQHGYSDGDPVVIAGATPSGYNGAFNITVIDEDTFSYPVESGLTSPATGSITATGYDETYFPAVDYATYQNLDLVLHESNGTIYALDDENFQDTGVPINTLLRLPPFDNGNKYRKTFSHIKPIGDLVDSDVLIRYSDDDGETWSKYRRCSMASESSMLRKLGHGRRRIWEVRHTEDTFLNLENLDQDFKQGF